MVLAHAEQVPEEGELFPSVLSLPGAGRETVHRWGGRGRGRGR